MSAPSFRQKFHSALTRVDAIAHASSQAFATWGLWSVLIGIFVGTGVLRGLRKLSWLGRANEVDHALFAIGGIALVGTGIAVIAFVRHRSIGFEQLRMAACWFNPRFSWLIAPRLLFALDRRTEHAEPFYVLTVATLAAGVIGISAYHWAWMPESRAEDAGRNAQAASSQSRWLKWSIAWALCGLFVAYTAIFTKLSWNNLWGFNMARSDMGYYVSIFRHSSQGHPLGMSLASSGNHLSGHFDPILVLLSPLYLIYPHAETILLLQAAWLGSGVFPVFLLARHFGCGRLGSMLLCVCYALYPALHGINLFDFHSIALAVPVIMWLLLFFEQARKLGFFVTFALLLMVREDMALVSCMFGFYALLSGKEHGRRWGWIVIVTALSWLIVVKGFVMTRSDLLMASDSSSLTGGGGGSRNKPSGYTRFYAELIPRGGNATTLLATLIGKPVRVLNTLLKEEKILYSLQILLPLSFLPLFARKKRWLLVYGFAFTLLASRRYLHSVHFQYSSVLVPFTFPLTASVLGSLRRQEVFGWLPLCRPRLYAALLGSSLVLTSVCTWKFGAIFPNTTFMAGFRPLVRNPSESQHRLAAWLKTVCRTLPPGAVVAANSRMLAHLGNCDKIVLAEDRKRADYLIYRFTKNPLTRRIKADIDAGLLEEVDHYGKTIVYETHYGERQAERRPSSKAKGKEEGANTEDTKRVGVQRKDAQGKASAPRDLDDEVLDVDDDEVRDVDDQPEQAEQAQDQEQSKKKAPSTGGTD